VVCPQIQCRPLHLLSLLSLCCSSACPLWPACQQPDLVVYNSEALQVLVIFHGYLNNVSDYYPLAQRLANKGYATVVPRDLQGVGALVDAAKWGREVTEAVRDWAGVNRPVGIIGHSMGGGAVMAAARHVLGISAFVSMHPATIVSGAGWNKVRGPILFTTGTWDDGTIGGNELGATAPIRALNAYNAADFPKALVNVKGNIHASSVAMGDEAGKSAQGDEWYAVTNWLGCFLMKSTTSCEWVRSVMCKSQWLEWCFHYGLEEAMFSHQPVHV